MISRKQLDQFLSMMANLEKIGIDFEIRIQGKKVTAAQLKKALG